MKFYLTDKKTNFLTKIYISIYYLVRLSLIGALSYAIYQRNWESVFITAIILILTFLPFFIEKRYNIEIPLEFEIIIVVFIYSSLFLGEIHKFYTRFWWWDIVLHTGSAMALGFIGFVILYILFHDTKIRFNASPFIIAIFSFCFAMAIGSAWEIFEFGMDQIFGWNMQKNGLVDTMWDLIVDAIGALIASLIGYLYLKNKEVFFLGKFMKNFKGQNKRLFLK